MNDAAGTFPSTVARDSVDPVPLTTVGGFDYETDVIIVGFGCAGAAAALEAAAAGADVLVLERLSGPGGSSAQSGGEIYLGGGTQVQKACGFEDSADDMYAYLRAALGPHADEEKLRLYCDESIEHFEWLRRQGISFQETLYDAPGWMAPTTDGLMWLGENAWPYGTLARPAPRGHRPPAENYGGWLLMEKLAAAVDAGGARTHTDTRAAALIADESGQVAGVTARHFGQDLRYRARKGVILTTGGFVDNEEMLAAHAPVLLGHGKVSDGGDDGSGIRMACALGAATRRMGMVEAALIAPPSLAYHGILVNALGQRFINEDVYPGTYSHAALLHQPAPWWVIIDQEGFEAAAATEAPGLQPQHVAETAAELGSELGMPAGALETTIATYNQDAARAEDRYFHKNARWLRELNGPLAAVDPRVLGVAAGTKTGIAGFTLGGLHTTVDGAVIHVSGRPIPRLYAAGRAAAGIHGEGYVSGTSLGDGTFFGRRAGRAAAR
ncbi:FAD-dependent oxidoreductase [Trebonia kvetii]|uniref:FAD-dependent oxidoreductase n=1 Tax=Trebonia kvetii TaxID=2480626 RepID=A0A6P2BT83_9ACTN|nr:FAD-dependent oxidoreductase [Trebonia kvetii]TVZ02180.1 FAD-dependent oxidoreductase [Trebonia kvetii]